MFCRNCGAQLPDTASFCSKCGTKVAPVAAPAEPLYQEAPAAEIPPVNPAEPVPNPFPVQNPFPIQNTVPETPAVADGAPAGSWQPPVGAGAQPGYQPFNPPPVQTQVPPVQTPPVQVPPVQMPPRQPAAVQQPAPTGMPLPSKRSAGSRVLAVLAMLLMIGAAVMAFLNTEQFRLIAVGKTEVTAGIYMYSMLGLKPLMGSTQLIFLIGTVAGFALAAIFLLLAAAGAMRGRLPFVLALIFGLIGLGCFGVNFYLVSQYPAGDAWEKTWKFMMDDEGLFQDWRSYLVANQSIPKTVTSPMLFGFILLGAGGLGTVLALIGACTAKKKA